MQLDHRILLDLCPRQLSSVTLFTPAEQNSIVADHALFNPKLMHFSRKLEHAFGANDNYVCNIVKFILVGKQQISESCARNGAAI